MGSAATGFPGVPQGAVTSPDGSPTPIWYQFFVALWNRTGGALGTVSLQLDTITQVLGSLLYRASSGWAGLGPGAQNSVLKVNASLPAWGLLDGNSFPTQQPSLFFAAPLAGGVASFRAVNTADLDPVAGQFPGSGTDDNADAGNVGEYIYSEIGSGAAVPLTSGTAADITSIELTPGDWDVWATVASDPAASTTTSAVNAWINTASATNPGAPNNGAYLSSQLTIGAGLGQVMPVGQMRISVAAETTATAYLSTNMTFAASTMGAYGFLGARRAR